MRKQAVDGEIIRKQLKNMILINETDFSGA
jgi:hypothetical protein